MTDRPEVEACVSRLLSRRDHSTGELRTKLDRRGFDASAIEEVIADYVDRGWVNDVAFARHQAQILADRGWGPTQIRAKLVRHGVSHELAKSTLASLDVDWVVAARARLAQKFGELGRDDGERAFRHLCYRGFSNDVARRAIFD